MNLDNQVPHQTLEQKQSPVFAHLKEKLFAEYNFIYHINEGYSIIELSKFSSKHQLLFKKISSNIKQLNLMIVDSVFPLILADLTLDVFLNNISSFKQYYISEKQLVVNEIEPYNEYIKYKLDGFIHYLIYSNISSTEICKGDIDVNKIYYLKNPQEEIQYYSIYEQKELKELLFEKKRLKINLEKSFIKNREANICLNIFFAH